MPDEATDLPDLPEIPEEVLISSPSQFEALTSSLRMRLLNLLTEPKSVREVAEHLDMPVTSLYYHVNLLESAGFIEVVHTRKSGARLEKIYRIAGRSITPGPELLANVEDTAAAAKAMASIVVEPARAETEDALEARFRGIELSMSLGRTMTALTPAQIDEIEKRLAELVADFMAGRKEHDDPEAREDSFTSSLVPTKPGTASAS